jgi:hypothetical protein
MARQDTIDFMAAFAIGAALGVGATLLLRSGNEDHTQRLIREIAPLRKEAGKRVRKARKHFTKRMREASSTGEDLMETGREALGIFRGQVAEIIEGARKDIASAARDSLRQARRTARRGLAQ